MSPTRRSRGEGSLFHRSDGMWIGRVELPSTDGKRRFKTVSSMKFNVASQKLRQLRKDVEAGRVTDAPSTTVGNWMDHWLKNIRGPHVRPTMFDHYEQAIRLHIKPHIGSKRLDRLTPEDVRSMHRAIQKSSTRAAQKAHQCLQSALSDAASDGLISRNVAEAVRMPRHTKIEREPFTFDVAKMILQTAVASCDETGASRWSAAFLTGARPAELRGLRWSYVDLTTGHVDLAWQLQRVKRVHGCGTSDGENYPCGRKRSAYCPQPTWRIPPGFELEHCHQSLCWTKPKTKAGVRIVPLLPPILAMLKELKAVDGYNPHDLVWHHPDGRPFTQEDESTAWKHLMELCGLVAEREWPPQYVARHTTSTLLLKAGVDEQTRMAIIGHSSIAAQRMYAHVDQSHARAAMEPLAALLA